jgi:ribosome-associated translation inhibitor RaiA
MRVAFKNLESSEFMRNLAIEKVNHVLEKFPELDHPTVSIVISMENSQFHAGRDLFKVKAIMLSRGLKPVIIEKEAINPYQAIAHLSDRMFEVIHRSLERRRERARSDRRKWKEVSFEPEGKRAG